MIPTLILLAFTSVLSAYSGTSQKAFVCWFSYRAFGLVEKYHGGAALMLSRSANNSKYTTPESDCVVEGILFGPKRYIPLRQSVEQFLALFYVFCTFQFLFDGKPFYSSNHLWKYWPPLIQQPQNFWSFTSSQYIASFVAFTYFPILLLLLYYCCCCSSSSPSSSPSSSSSSTTNEKKY